MNEIDNEIAKYKKIVQDKEDEQKRVQEARTKIIELERQKQQDEIDRQNQEKLARARAIYDKVDKTYSPVYVKIGSEFVQADKFWLTASHECIGCGTGKNGIHKFFHVKNGNDEGFVEQYMPR